MDNIVLDSTLNTNLSLPNTHSLNLTHSNVSDAGCVTHSTSDVDLSIANVEDDTSFLTSNEDGCFDTKESINNNSCNVTPPVDDSTGSVETIDRLTAMEMLQLLKEYKKREFLYISQLTTLQKELFLLSNGSSTPAFEINPGTFHNISASGQTALLDPTVHLEIRELRLKLYEQGLELQKTKDELRASTFSADSVMGRRLINKCKALQEENTDIGKMLVETHLQPLQIQTGILQKQLLFFKQQLKTLHELNADLDEDNERLTRQLQELTIHYKTTQQEKEMMAKELLILQNEQTDKNSRRITTGTTTSNKSNSYHRRGASTSDGGTDRRLERSISRRTGGSSRRKRSNDTDDVTTRIATTRASDKDSSTTQSRPGSQTRHRQHRKDNGSSVMNVPSSFRDNGDTSRGIPDDGDRNSSTKDLRRQPSGTKQHTGSGSGGGSRRDERTGRRTRRGGSRDLSSGRSEKYSDKGRLSGSGERRRARSSSVR